MVVGIVVATVALQQEVPEFTPPSGRGLPVRCLHAFCAGTPASSKDMHLVRLGQLVPVAHRCECEWQWLSVSLC